MPCRFEREREGRRVVIRIAGVFDDASACELRHRLDAEAEDLVLDFSLVREFAGVGVSTLALGLADGERRLIALRGLGQDRLRIFRYFGVDVTATQSAGGPGQS